MPGLKLSLACGAYDLLSPLIDGTATAPGIEFNALTMASPERHGRMFRHEEFDVCELSIVGYLIAREAGRALTAIPVFPHRRFRHGYVFKRMHSSIEKPADFNGKRVGLRTLQNSAGLWMRGILHDHHGVDLTSIEWWCQEEEKIPVSTAASMKVRLVPKGRNIDQMLVEGQLEAAIYPEILPSIRSGSPKAGLMFPDVKMAENEYYKKSGIFPIMHTVVIRNEILEKNPWAAVSVVQGFQKAKEHCYRRMHNPRNFALVWMHELMQEQEEIFGRDPWPYNLEDNRKTLEAVVRYAHDEGMIKTQPKIEELFYPSTLQEKNEYLS